MPTVSEISQFRRLIGDWGVDNVDEGDLDSYLDDAARQLSTADRALTPVTTFDAIDSRYKPETVILAAINWWWDKAAKLLDKHSTTVGQASQNVGEKYDRAMQMIERLQAMFLESSKLTETITIGNLSRFSKTTLTRIGGKREEDYFEG